VNGVPHLLLIFIDHCPGAHRRLHHQAHSGRFCRSAEDGTCFSPASRLDAEDIQVNRIASRRHDAVLGDYAVLLAAGNDFAGQQKQGFIGIIHQYQRVYLVSAIELRLRHGMCDSVV